MVIWPSPSSDLAQPLPAAPLDITDVIKYVPRITTPRLRVQSGLFTAHPDPMAIFGPSGIQRITIPHGKRQELKVSLHRHGINESVLFPEVDRLARHIDWLQTSSH